MSRVESGRAQPSRRMVARLADALGMPLRERNVLLAAAGYAAEYPERGLDTPEMRRSAGPSTSSSRTMSRIPRSS